MQGLLRHVALAFRHRMQLCVDNNSQHIEQLKNNNREYCDEPTENFDIEDDDWKLETDLM